MTPALWRTRRHRVEVLTLARWATGRGSVATSDPLTPQVTSDRQRRSGLWLCGSI
jgi:hypothetical protein